MEHCTTIFKKKQICFKKNAEKFLQNQKIFKNNRRICYTVSVARSFIFFTRTSPIMIQNLTPEELKADLTELLEWDALEMQVCTNINAEEYHALGYTGTYPLMKKANGTEVLFVEEHPFTVMEWDSYSFRIHEIIR